MIYSPSPKNIISSILLCALWGILLQVPLVQFQSAMMDSIWPALIFMSLFVLQPVLIYYSLKGLLSNVKSLFFIAICAALVTGSVFLRYQVLHIDQLLDDEGILITGTIIEARTYSRRRRSNEWLVRATYFVGKEVFLTPEFDDKTKSLRLKDSVHLIYVRSNPAISQIKY
jgi:hypothetical protein